MSTQAVPQAWQALAEMDQFAEFAVITRCSPSSMIAVLFASARIAAGRLKVPACVRADPYIGVSRRNGEIANAFQRRRVRDAFPVGREIAKALARTSTADARFGVTDMDEASELSAWRSFSNGGRRHVSARVR